MNSLREDAEPQIREWPKPAHALAFSGLAGDIVRVIEPQSEADPAALLVQLLVAFGSAVGRGPHYKVEGDEHHMNLNALVVGQTSSGRKGVSWARVRAIVESAAPNWVNRIASGLTSGEGLVYHVRDGGNLVQGHSPPRRRLPEYDPGVEDKRLIVIETEFAAVLGVMAREGNTLSPVLRDAWDGRSLSTLSKNSPVRATSPHISVVGHVTAHELRRKLGFGEIANGFLNRFLLVCARRSKQLPDGGSPPLEDLEPLQDRMRVALTTGGSVGPMERDPAARSLWASVYGRLSEGRDGLVGTATSRAEAQVLRLQCLYALLDNSSIIKQQHLLAALAVWEYVQRSSEFLLEDLTGDRTSGAILRNLRASDGLTRNAIQRQVFAGHGHRSQIDSALEQLSAAGLARCERVATKGRHRNLWVATSGPAAPQNWLAELLDAHLSLRSRDEGANASTSPIQARRDQSDISSLSWQEASKHPLPHRDNSDESAQPLVGR